MTCGRANDKLQGPAHWSVYEDEFAVRFGDCDPARIMYFPNYFDYFHAAMEDFFRDRLDTQYHLLLEHKRVSFPTVRLEVNFSAPVRFGDAVTIAVEVVRIGRSSVDLRYTGRRSSDGKQVVVATATTVATDMDEFHGVELTGDLLGALERERDGALAAAADNAETG